MANDSLRTMSPITYWLERLFFYLQNASPANLLFKKRAEHQAEMDSLSETARQDATAHRARQIEGYLLAWLAIETTLVVLAPILVGLWRLLLLLAGFRVFEVSQAAINMNLFDGLRRGPRPHQVATLTRTMVLSFWNFLELAICFGIIYAGDVPELSGATSWLDPYYFSVVTQLTVGYGDIHPLCWLKAAVMLQGILGFLFTLFVLSRLIAMMRRMEPIYPD